MLLVSTWEVFFLILMGIAMIAKSIIHWHLHKKNNHSYTRYWAIIKPHPIVAFPYTKPVTEDYKQLKLICNVLWVFYTLIFFIVFFIGFIKQQM